MDGRDLTDVMNHAIDPMGLMQRVTDRTVDLIGPAEGVMVGLVDGDAIVYVSGAGNQVGLNGTRVHLHGSLSGLSIRTRQVLLCHDAENDPRVDAEACRRHSVRSLVCVPLIRAGETVGVMAVNAPTPRAFTEDHVATLGRLAEFLSVAIGSAIALDRSAQLLVEVEERLANAPGPGEDPNGAGRYVLGVLTPDLVPRLDSVKRIGRYLDGDDALEMLFQPIFDALSGEVIAVEALARFESEPYRAPDDWFTEAHLCGLGVDLELLAIEKALACLDQLPPGVALTVNVGPEAVLSPRFPLTFSGIPLDRIILELTEHSAVGDYPDLIGSLRMLRRNGMRIAIDDTGSGYSSLAHILKMAPELIKLDRELTGGIDLDPVRRALAAALVAFGADTGAIIVAEGVETEDELDVLRGLNVPFVQGYHLGHPAPLHVALAPPPPAVDLTDPTPDRPLGGFPGGY